MSGNVAEWTATARPYNGMSASTCCAAAPSTTTSPGSDCDYDSDRAAEDYWLPDTGFRCCSSCAPGLADCGGSCVDLGTSQGNCGACGVACPAGKTCGNGQCE